MVGRRSFLLGLGAAIAAPAVIHTAGLLMPVRAPLVDNVSIWLVDWGESDLRLISPNRNFQASSKVVDLYGWMRRA